MSIFRRKDKRSVCPIKQEQQIIEIAADKQAQQEVVQQAKEASERLNTLLVENGFTLKIYLAAGGKKPKNEVKHG